MEVSRTLRSSLDAVKMKASNGVDYWATRDLQAPLGYRRWEKFERVVQKAIMACDSAGIDSSNHFHPRVKMVGVGSGAKRETHDWYVSRYAAYLIAMNGNPELPQIAEAQRYFAVQTRRQELADQAQDVSRRVELRDRVKDANKHLNKAAQDSGVQNYGLFHNAGYRGLYGLSLSEILDKKGIGRKEQLLDRAGRTELAANEFRITQAEEALRRDQVRTEHSARQTHNKVGAAVRQTIANLVGTMPEDLPAEESLKKLVTSDRKAQKRLKDEEQNKK